jgi:hypothetical protein
MRDIIGEVGSVGLAQVDPPEMVGGFSPMRGHKETALR